MTEREQIIEVVNRLFIYTDYQDWAGLKSKVFTEQVYLDMTSMGGTAADTTAEEICKQWEEGFRGLDAVHHLAGNYLVEISEGIANVTCYANAAHYKAAALNGKTREFIGLYELKLIKTRTGWRINSFRYRLKYSTGNLTLE